MQPATFELITIGNVQVITGSDTDLRVFIHRLEGFEADGHKIQFYAYPYGHGIAFEASWTEETLPMIGEAIAWYAGFIGNPDMELMPAPRVNRQLHLVR